MDSREILSQFFSGALNTANVSTAFAELQKIVERIGTPSDLHESACARYALGFIRRLIQYKRDEASELDLCMNLRDLVIVNGSIRVSDLVYQIAKQHRSEFGFLCENNNQVSCIPSYPEWLHPQAYINDVYRLRYMSDQDFTALSVGDEILSGFTKFRTYKSFEQKMAVHMALKLPEGYTLLVSQPTGGGKSLVTQMLTASSVGLTLVIVPTVALALDQYYAAKDTLRETEDIYCYRGDQSTEERVKIIHAIRDKTARLLFTSPEAILKNTELFNLLENGAKDAFLKNVVVDEAHVVPDWGVFFRPDFQLFSIALKKWRKNSSNSIRTFLLSATLSDDVVETLLSLFGSEGMNTQLRCDSLRQEPRFYFYPVKGRKEQHEKTIEAAKLLPKPLVIYVLEPREATELRKQFLEQGYQNIPCFTGDTRDNERDIILRGWKENQYDIVIATSAFGIGVDKPDVRTIIHACAPENLSRFYQEVGRAGRDRLPSISLLMPYTSNLEGEGDLSRAFGLVNKRVLTVKTMVTRWFSMFRSDAAIVGVDECILDTSVASSAMSADEAEYVGNRNMAWNVNLLLFLHRTGFIALEDVCYDVNKRSFLVTAKLLKPEIMSDRNALNSALEEPRAEEYAKQTADYRAMSKLISSPNTRCWGRAFRSLFPLAVEVCHGCPSDPTGRITTDSKYKVREKPILSLPAHELSRVLQRHMGSYRTLIVHNQDAKQLTEDELNKLCQKAENCGIGTIIIPNTCQYSIHFSGLVLTFDEFFFASTYLPYLFNSGVLCLFPDDQAIVTALYTILQRLSALNYPEIIYCDKSFRLSTTGKTIADSIDGYSISLDKF